MQAAQAATQSFDARELRHVLGSFVTGVTVITTVDSEGGTHGLTANSFSSVSLDPPLILWSQSRSAPSHRVFSACKRFAVNILAEDQVEISNRFARRAIDKFEGVDTRPGFGGVPLIHGCAAYLECRLVNAFPGGDHTVFIGQVERLERHARQPLVFGGGQYLVAQPHDMGPVSAERGPNIARLKAVRIAARAVAQLSKELDETIGLGVWGTHGPTIVLWEEARAPVSDNLRVGLVLPMATSATGLAFAAWLPREVTAPFIDAEHPDERTLEQRLEQIRRGGCARLVGTDAFVDLYGESISAISVPVFDNDGAMVLALTAIGAADRLDTTDDGAVLPRLRECALAISGRLRAAA